MPLFPTSSSPHSLGRGSQSSGSWETAPFYSNVSSPLDFATASSAAPHQPLQCPVPLEVRMGGTMPDLRGGRGVRLQLHQLGGGGAELATLPVGTGWTAPSFPLQESQRRSAWARSAPLAQEVLRSSLFPGVLFLPTLLISPVLNIASSPFLELPVSGCARDAPVSAVPGRWSGRSGQSEVW